MTQKEKAPFVALGAEVNDEELERLAGLNGVGTYVAPEPEETSVNIKTQGYPTPRNRMKTLSIDLPDYAFVDLKIKAAKDGVSVRHIVMNALKSHGIEISEADLIEDGRRLR